MRVLPVFLSKNGSRMAVLTIEDSTYSLRGHLRCSSICLSKNYYRVKHYLGSVGGKLRFEYHK
ncbi:hypothetical protein MUP37_02255, partial [Candidatus Bathyarchaeota archaeon]|nr:hypothetical protein [Candidatus Bathyarchaeota archaeon]